MKIKSVRIQNYKSIKDVTIPFSAYGQRTNKSSAAFLVGINEGGKTALLEALSFLKKGLSGVDYEEACNKEALENEEYIDIYVTLAIGSQSFWTERLTKDCGIPVELSKKIKFKKLEKNLYLDTEGSSFHYTIEIENIPLYEYVVESSLSGVGLVGQIKSLKEQNSVSEKITQSNAAGFLTGNQKTLEMSDIEEMIPLVLQPIFERSFPSIQIWRPEKKYLISTTIDLAKFKEDPNISLPLKNIFHIYGKTDNKNIKATIERALKKQEYCDELKDKLSISVTKHLNEIWKEHKIKIVVSINGNNCHVFVEDNDKKHSYYKMSQRSDGFKQFVSLILSLSALNVSEKLKNNIILIDEPEVHLHPSGVRYMRDEILKIGKNNQVFASTHSHYLVDTTSPERHWIVKKEKSETTISQIGEDTPIEDDKVLMSAFGLNVFIELLPKNIVVVEGGDDKLTLLHSIDKIRSRFFYSIKSAGGASKVPGIASILGDESVPAYVLFDDDKEGRDNKKKILENLKNSFSKENVFTIRDIESSLPIYSTLEDLMPVDFVKEHFDSKLNGNFNIDPTKAIVLQLKRQNIELKDKQKMASIKLSLAKKFIAQFNTKQKIESQSPRMAALVSALVSKIESKE